MPPDARYEAVIFVRIDNMENLTTVGQRSIRFPLVDDGHPIPLLDLYHMALTQAPPVHEWDA